MFRCSVCDVMLTSNGAFSCSNVTMHYKAKNNNINGILMRLNFQNTTENILISVKQDERDRNNAQVSKSSIKCFLRPACKRWRNPLNPY